MSKSYKIGVIPGDGTGPEVVAEGKKVLEAASNRFSFSLDFQDYDFGGDRYLATGEVLPDSAVEELRAYDAIYLGAIGHPDVKPGILEKGILLHLRFELDQYINLRPVKLYPGVDTPLKNKGPADIDYVVVRENTGGIYTGTGGFSMKDTAQEVAVQSMVYSRHQVERCLHRIRGIGKNRRSYFSHDPRHTRPGVPCICCGRTHRRSDNFDNSGDRSRSGGTGLA